MKQIFLGVFVVFILLAGVFVPVYAAELPDLIIDSVVFNPTTKLPTVVIKNIGSATAFFVKPKDPSVLVKWYKANGEVASSYSTKQLIDIKPSLLPGEALTINGEFSFTYPLSGATLALIKVDMSNVIEESDENNNEVKLDIDKLYPDLTFGKIIYNEEKLEVEIKNNGEVAAEKVLVKTAWVDDEGNLKGLYSDGDVPNPKVSIVYNISNFSSGKSISFTYEAKAYSQLYKTPPGATKLRLEILVENSISEINKTNNKAYVKEIIKPDLTFGEVLYTDEALTVVVKNIGKLAITNSDALDIIGSWLDSSGKKVPTPNTVTTGYGSDSGLAAGATIKKVYQKTTDPNWISFVTPPPEAKKLRLELDWGEDVDEFNEKNNEVTLDLLRPDLYLSSLVVTDELYSFIFGNSGSLSTPNAPLKLQWYNASNDAVGKPFVISVEEIMKPGKEDKFSAKFPGEDPTLQYGIDAFIFKPFEGGVTLRIDIDPENKFAELKENNNQIKALLVSAKTSANELIKTEEKTDTDQMKDSAKYIPKILPGNPLYVFKDAARAFGSFFTFNKEKKAELKLKYANEKMIETSQLLDKGNTKKATEHLISYTKDIKAANDIIETMRNKDKNKAEKIIEKALKETVKHQTVISRLEKNSSTEISKAVKDEREKTFEEIARLVNNIDDGEKKDELLTKVFDDNGSPFKPLRNIEILKAVTEKVPKEARSALINVQEKSLDRLNNQIEALSDDNRKLLLPYVEQAGGEKLRYLDTLEDLRAKDMSDSARSSIDISEEKIYNQVKDARNSDADFKQIEEQRNRIMAPTTETTDSSDRRSAPPSTSPSRESTTTESPSSTPSSREDRPLSSCSSEYTPVCGRDNLTYGNECRARESGTTVQYQGVCNISRPSR